MQQSSGNLETSKPTNQPSNSVDGSNRPVTTAVKGTLANGKSETPASQKPPLSLADLFKKVDPENPDDNRYSVEEEDVDDPSKPVDSIDRLMKRHKMTPEQVYAIKVPMPDGAEPLSLGDLKDRVGELVGFEARELEFDVRRRESEGELLRAQNEMRELLALIPKEHIKPEMVEKVRKKHEATQTRERQLTLQHIPAWRNEETRTADIEGMVGVLSNYGFEESFIATVVDHRAIKLLRDFYLMDKRIKAALGKVTIPLKKGKAPSQKTQKPAQNVSDSQRGHTALGNRDRIAALFNKNSES